MAYRNLKMIMPTVDNLIMQINGMSEAQYDGAWIIGWSQYNDRRPIGWPTAFTLMAHYGFMPDGDGWREFIRLHIGVDVASGTIHRQIQGEERAAKRWKLADKPDYTATHNEAHETIWNSGMAVCEETYRQTGRMILR
jgi:hypothetical protein